MPNRKYAATFGDVNVIFSKNKNKGCSMKQLKSLLPAALFTLCVGLPSVSSAADLTISCGAVGAELQLCKEAVDVWSKQTGNNVQVVSTPNSATERLSFYQQILSAQSADIDIIQIDMVWPGMLAKHLMDLREVLPANATQGYFQAQVDNATVNGRLVTMPWFTDSGLLYYRKDLLEKYNKQVPQTWEEMTATAREVQLAERNAGNANVWGYIFQGRAYEGLTCNAMEWISSQPEGGLVNPRGDLVVNSQASRTAWRIAVGKCVVQAYLALCRGPGAKPGQCRKRQDRGRSPAPRRHDRHPCIHSRWLGPGGIAIQRSSKTRCRVG